MYCPGCEELRTLRQLVKSLRRENARLAGHNTMIHRQKVDMEDELRAYKRSKPCYQPRCRFRLNEDAERMMLRALPEPENEGVSDVE